MIIVPVTINETGPFDFLFDTGSSHTIIDRKLAEKLHLPTTGLVLVRTAQDNASTSLVDAESLSISGAVVHDLKLVVVNRYADFLPGVSGSVGEDFLQNFDFLIDNRRHLLQIGPAGGALTDMLAGEHLPISLHGSYEQNPTPNRLIVVGNFSGDYDRKLQLDSGASTAVLFSRLNPPIAVSDQLTVHLLGGIFGSSFEATAQTVGLRLGEKTYRNIAVLVPSGSSPPMDVDGYLPTSLFRSIFISHSGKFAIIDPSTKPAPIQSKSALRQAAETSGVQSLEAEPPTSR
jgi:hypothetical protein